MCSHDIKYYECPFSIVHSSTVMHFAITGFTAFQVASCCKPSMFHIVQLMHRGFCTIMLHCNVWILRKEYHHWFAISMNLVVQLYSSTAVVYRTCASVQLNTYSRSEGMIIIITSVWEYPDPSHVRCT